MSERRVELLREIATLSSQIVEITSTSETAHTSKCTPSARSAIDALFTDTDAGDNKEALSLAHDLESLGLDASLSRRLRDVYKKYTANLQRNLEQQWSAISLQVVDGAARKGLSTLLRNEFFQSVHKLRNTIVGCTEEACGKFFSDAEKALHHQSQVISKDQGVTGKGHPKLAVAILEKVFARTPNITKAEKLKLSAETGLEPRQVTIWFQNRRNRKPPNPPTTTEILPMGKRKSFDSDVDIREAQRQKRDSASSKKHHGIMAVTGSDDSNDTTFSSAAFSFTTTFKQSWSDTSSVDELQSLTSSSASPRAVAVGAVDDADSKIFDDYGRIKLDSDDLRLDLPRLEREAHSRLSTDVDLFERPIPAAYLSDFQAASSYNFTSSKSYPTVATYVGTRFEAGISAWLSALFSTDMDKLLSDSRGSSTSASIQNKRDPDTEVATYLDLESLMTPESISQTNSAPTSVDTPPSQPPPTSSDPFSFDMNALGLIDSHAANKASFEASLKLPPADLLDTSVLDLNLSFG